MGMLLLSLFLVSVAGCAVLSTALNPWRRDTAIPINHELLDAMSAYVGVPPEEITDAHIAYLFEHALVCTKQGALSVDKTIVPMYQKAIEQTYERAQPAPRRGGESK